MTTSLIQRNLTRWVVTGSVALPTLLLALATVGQKKPVPLVTPTNTLFESKIRPLLLSSCISCHGKESPQGGLRLDVPLPLDKAKEVVRRVKGEGGKPRMPLGTALPKEKILALEQWVGEGAIWSSGKAIAAPNLMELGKKHWSFLPRKRSAMPVATRSQWSQNPLDAFILQRLTVKGLKPSPTASRRELIRRVTYDLTGLPPSPEEVVAFEKDLAPNAYATLVDRLLASPRYGEKWGRHWLDLVRYAETNSYERDNPKPNIYKYRDYVIRAFNADKPFDQFVKEQLAGDELPDASGDALVATAYYRLGIWDDEPADVVQATYDDLDDLVATTGQAFLGLTLDCARCHDHKLDPIPQKDYYRFVSFFHNINRFKNGGPTDEAMYFETPEKKREYETKSAELEAKRGTNKAQITEIETLHSKLRPKIINPNDLTDLQYRYYEGAWQKIPDFDKLKPVASGSLNPALLDIRPRKRDGNFAFVFEAMLNAPQEGEYTLFMDTDDGSRLLVDGRAVIEKNTDGGQGNEKSVKVHLKAGRTPIRVEYFQAGGPFGLSVAWGGTGFPRRPLSTLESCGAMGLPTLMNAELPLLLNQEKATQYAQLLTEKVELAKQTLPIEMALCVTEAGKKAPDTFVLLRGNPTTPGEKVTPAFPICAGGGEALVPEPPSNTNTAGRRTLLANWIASPNNPLTARVIVNRIWQHHFGRGIVRTPNDFGLQGARPTHPELLDWLAEEFIKQGWSFKNLHRVIMNSNTYKQSSRANPKGLSVDPQNEMLWRFDMRRLTAEEIRDSVLAVSGNLNLAMYGTPVYPEIAKDILAGQSVPGADWHTDKMRPEDVNRRSIYIHVKRSLTYPLLAAFDLPETDRSSSARFSSTQSTQALGLMNGVLINKQAGLLAERVRKEVGQETKVFARRLLTLVLQRNPTNNEVVECLRLAERLLRRGVKPEQAQVYLALMALNLDEFIYLD